MNHFLRLRIDKLLLARQLFHARRRNQFRFLQLERRLLARQALGCVTIASAASARFRKAGRPADVVPGRSVR